MKPADTDSTLCAIARATAVAGDRWTLLILRELSFGTRRFDDIQAQTGMSSQVLAARLAALEEAGIIERRPYSERPARFEYFATERGKDLDAVLAMYRAWGMKWGELPAGAPPATTLTHKRTRRELGATMNTGTSTKDFRLSDFAAEFSPAFKAERERRRTAFQAAKAQQRAGKTAR
jgi:DNA-binding HxlR family transcriptional regulator